MKHWEFAGPSFGLSLWSLVFSVTLLAGGCGDGGVNNTGGAGGTAATAGAAGVGGGGGSGGMVLAELPISPEQIDFGDVLGDQLR